MADRQQNSVQNQTAAMLEIGTSLLNQTAEQTRKLTDVEAQVGEAPGDTPSPRRHLWTVAGLRFPVLTF